MKIITHEDDGREEFHSLWDENIIPPAQQVDRRGIVELVHDDYITKGYRTRAEAEIHLGRPGMRAVVLGENGKWYCLSIQNARKYNLAVDAMKRRAQ
jgi:hypothetical protein